MEQEEDCKNSPRRSWATTHMGNVGLYGPFGKLIGKWGILADANEMQFSSMPQHDGLTFFPFRAYEPNFQRFLNQDPIQEAGGINLYQFALNNPI